jgi:hypothetical protein
MWDLWWLYSSIFTVMFVWGALRATISRKNRKRDADLLNGLARTNELLQQLLEAVRGNKDNDKRNNL